MEKLIQALKDGTVSIFEIIEELNYRDMSHLTWNDSLFEYTTEELQQIESNADEYMTATSIVKESLRIVDRMWGVLSNKIADKPEQEVMADINNAIPQLEEYITRLKELSGKYTPGAVENN